jgi:hypothetical protein
MQLAIQLKDIKLRKMKTTYHAKFGKGTIVSETELDYTIKFEKETKVMLKKFVILSDEPVQLIDVTTDHTASTKRFNQKLKAETAKKPAYKVAFEKEQKFAELSEIYVDAEVKRRMSL